MVVVSPDGRLVAAGSLDTMVRVWDVSTGKQIERLKGHKDSVYSYVTLVFADYSGLVYYDV